MLTLTGACPVLWKINDGIIGQTWQRIASDKHANYEQYAVENESKFVPLAMDNRRAIHKEFADFIAASARIAENAFF